MKTDTKAIRLFVFLGSILPAYATISQFTNDKTIIMNFIVVVSMLYFMLYLIDRRELNKKIKSKKMNISNTGFLSVLGSLMMLVCGVTLLISFIVYRVNDSEIAHNIVKVLLVIDMVVMFISHMMRLANKTSYGLIMAYAWEVGFVSSYIGYYTLTAPRVGVVVAALTGIPVSIITSMFYYIGVRGN